MRIIIKNTLLLGGFLTCLISGLIGQATFIISGGQVRASGSPYIVLNNTNWENNGQFTANNSIVVFEGNQTTSISGTNMTYFWDVTLNKSGGKNLQLDVPTAVDDSVRFVAGMLDLNGNDLALGTTSGGFSGEAETTRAIGPAGGEIIKTATLSGPAGINPGNLGVSITATGNLGSTEIRRGHVAQTIPGGNSIERYYRIAPTNNGGLNATVRASYFDGELNGLNENVLEFWHEDLPNWYNIEPSSTDGTANYVEVVRDDLERMTLGEGGMKISPKTFLQGSYAGGIMGDNLRANGLIPITEPFTAMGFTQVGGGGETIDPAILAVTGNSAIVDWIFLELRDKNNGTTVLRTQSALIQRDGDIVGLDGESHITFAGILPDNYYLVLRHRNHLGVRTPGAIPLVNFETTYDFSTAQSQAWDNPAIATNPAMVDLGGGVFGLFRGDVNSDERINIVDFLLSRNNSTPNQSGVYLPGDINMESNINVVDYLIGRAQSSPNKVGHN